MKIEVTHGIADFTGQSILKMIQALNKLRDEYGQDAVVLIDAGFENYSVEVTYTREETGAEREYRQRSAEGSKAKSEAKIEKLERAELKRLQQKYGGRSK